MIDILSTFSIEIGAYSDIPILIINYGDNSYNCLEFLTNRDVYTMIHWCVQLAGNVMIFCTIFDVIAGINDLMHGRFKLGNHLFVETDEYKVVD